MKIEREIFDNDKYIMHCNYDKSEIDRIRQEMKKMMELSAVVVDNPLQ